MFRNYFNIAWRNIVKNKTSSFINIFGLSVGIACCMLISIYMYNEYHYDRYHTNADRVYQLGTDFMDDKKESRAASTSGAIARMMQEDFPEIETTARIMSLFRDDKTLLQITAPDGSTKAFYETAGYLADSSLFQVLTFPFKEGNPDNALAKPNSIVINDDIARKLFGDTLAVDKTIRISSTTNGDHDYRVTGVYTAPPAPGHLNARFIMSFAGGDANSFANNNPSPVFNNMFFSYLLLRPGTDAKKLEAKFPAFIEKRISEYLKDIGMKRGYMLTNVRDIHLSPIARNVTPGGNKTSLFILASIAVLTLLIACINFMNLATAGSAKRAAEVGVRKVLGAEKKSLVRQFLGESLLMAIVALLFAAVITWFLLPLFMQVAGREISIQFSAYYPLLAGFIVLTIITGLLAGIYPAFYLSSFKPIKVLKGKFSNSLAAASLRRGMVVFQFVISIALIVASVVIAQQMSFLRSKELGFQRDQQLIIPLRTENARTIVPALKTALQAQPSVVSVGASATYPGIMHPQDWLMYKDGQAMKDAKDMFINQVDDGFITTLGLKTVAGRIFSGQFPGDTNTKMVLNEEAVRQYGFKSPEAALGNWLAFDWQGRQYRFNIIGVVKDFHFKDLHETIQPLAFLMPSDGGFGYMVVHLKKGDLNTSLSAVTRAWKQLNPNEPFEYSFMDQDFQKNYEAENRQGSMIRYFTIIAIIISCLGLFGLATFTAEQRTKEIGIRKVLGASVGRLVALLSTDFLKLVGIAIFIALPVAWYGMNNWLENFAYRIEVGWQVFVISILIAVFIAMFTISFQAVKAAISNPVKNLRTE